MAATSNTNELYVDEMLSCISYGPVYDNESLFAIGGNNKLYIGLCTIECDVINTDTLVSVPCTGLGSINCISWTDDAEINVEGHYYVSLVLAGDSDYCVYTLTLQVGLDNSVLLELGQHDNYINGIDSVEQMIATVGDDLVCKIWNIKEQSLMTVLQLSSPGVSVMFHNIHQVAVTERQGRIRLYHVNTSTPICSLECSTGSILHSDWLFTNDNNYMCSSASGSYVHVWKLNTSSVPCHTLTCTGQQSIVKWCKQNSSLLAVISYTGRLQIHNFQYQKKLTMPATVPEVVQDLCWHPAFPIATIISNNSIIHWDINK